MKNSITTFLSNNWRSIKKNHVLFTILGIGFVFLLWFIFSISFTTTLFPSIDQTFSRMGYLFTLSYTWEAIGGTLLRLLISLLISIIFSLILGLFGGLYRQYREFLNPLIIVLRTLPAAAIIYTIIVLTKIQYSLYIIVFLATFPIIYEGTVNGIATIDNKIFENIKLDSHLLHPRVIFKIYFPSAKKNILVSIIQSLGLGMKVSLMAEILCGTDKIPGIGRIIYHGYNEGDMETVFAGTLIAIFFTIIFDLSLRIYKENIIKEQSINRLSTKNSNTNN